MGVPKICECTGTLNLLFSDIVFKANICPDCKLPGSNVSLMLDNLSFESTNTNLPNYFSVAKGAGLSVSGTGILTLSEEKSLRDNNAFYTLFLFDSYVGNQNLASLSFSSIDEVGAILAYAITFISSKVSLTINPFLAQYSSVPFESFSLPKEEEIGKGKIIIVKNDQIEVREL